MANAGSELLAVPLFPLPNVVLFPQALLPLHIFETRYREMTADALAGDKLIAMALLKPGWERHAMVQPPLDPIVCIGRIVTSQRLEDGRYHLLLQGHQRARLVEEAELSRSYRQGKLEIFPDPQISEIDLANDRQRLITLFGHGTLAGSPIAQKFASILAGPTSTAIVADLIAFHFFQDTCLKQSLLAQEDVRGRVWRIVSQLQEICSVMDAQGSADWN